MIFINTKIFSSKSMIDVFEHNRDISSMLNCSVYNQIVNRECAYCTANTEKKKKWVQFIRIKFSQS
jgi:hypothetical protein